MCTAIVALAFGGMLLGACIAAVGIRNFVRDFVAPTPEEF